MSYLFLPLEKGLGIIRMPATFDDARMMPTRAHQIFFCYMWAPSDDAQMMPTRKNAVYIVKMNRKFFSIRQFLTPKITCGVLLANSCMWGTFVNSAIVVCGVLLVSKWWIFTLKIPEQGFSEKI